MTEFPLAFLGMFEALRMGPTFARGRRDERAGHVRSLTVSGSLVVALVRGPDDPAAFRSRIAVRAFGASEWARVETALVAEARFAADLLDGRMPAGIEAVFAGAGLSLLPLSLDEVAMDCTCERWPMPCAHLAATCYALARAFETDPFEVFTWRGRPRDELLMRLRRLREAAAVDAARPGFAARSSAAGGGGGPAWADSTDASGAPAPGHSRASDGSGAAEGRRGSTARAAAADPVAFWGWPEPQEAAAAPGDPESGSPSGRDTGWRSERAAGSGDEAGSGLRGERRAGSRSEAQPGSRREREAGSGDAAGAERRSSAAEGDTAPAGVSEGVRADALLDQLDAPGLVHHGRPVVEVLRPAYLALPDGEYMAE